MRGSRRGKTARRTCRAGPTTSSSTLRPRASATIPRSHSGARSSSFRACCSTRTHRRTSRCCSRRVHHRTSSRRCDGHAALNLRSKTNLRNTLVRNTFPIKSPKRSTNREDIRTFHKILEKNAFNTQIYYHFIWFSATFSKSEKTSFFYVFCQLLRRKVHPR